MAPVLIVPGIGGSGPEHWQSRWEAREPAFRRVQMPSWDRPELTGWLEALSAAVDSAGAPPVVVAHSLGCLAFAHFIARGGRARAALLVAPPDPDGPCYPAAAHGFGPAPRVRLPLPSRVVASRNDPYGGMVFARSCARAWESELVDVGEVGHINADSHLGDWPSGRALLADLLV
jgi:predicted alpha/beta hydrolase family esterase